MTPRLVFIISITLLFGVNRAVAQEDSLGIAGTSQAVAEDSIVRKAGFALELSADYGKGIESLVSSQKKWEFGLNAIISNKVALALEYGHGALFPQSVIQNGDYEVKGNYYRVGAEYLFTILPKHQLGLGAMYANSKFSDFGAVRIYSEFWPDVSEEFSRNDFSASWAEIILNTQGPVVNAESGFMSNLYWGIRFRARIMISDLEQPVFNIYAVPGFGKTYSRVVPAANLFLRYRINF